MARAAELASGQRRQHHYVDPDRCLGSGIGGWLRHRRAAAPAGAVDASQNVSSASSSTSRPRTPVARAVSPAPAALVLTDGHVIEGGGNNYTHSPTRWLDASGEAIITRTYLDRAALAGRRRVPLAWAAGRAWWGGGQPLGSSRRAAETESLADMRVGPAAQARVRRRVAPSGPGSPPGRAHAVLSIFPPCSPRRRARLDRRRRRRDAGTRVRGDDRRPGRAGSDAGRWSLPSSPSSSSRAPGSSGSVSSRRSPRRGSTR